MQPDLKQVSMKESGLLPYHAVLELTYRCNFNCLFCYCKGRELAEMNLLQWQTWLHEIYRRGVRSITFSGGEPLLRNDLRQIVEYSKTAVGFLDCQLFTNGSLLSVEVCRYLQKYDVSVCVSLSGKSHYAEMTLGNCSYDIILNNIRLCKESGLEVSVSSVLTKSNYREMRSVISDVTSVGVRYVQFGFVMHEGGMLEHHEEGLSYSDKRWVLQSIPIFRRQFPNCEIRIATETRCLCQGHLSRLLVRLLGDRCEAGKRFVVISPNGRIKPCVHML